MNSKAVSPMIATILLIAFTVAVGGIISAWLTTYTRTTGAAVSEATESQIKCTGTLPNIMSVTSNSIFVINSGSQQLANVTCYAGNGTLIGNLGTLSPGAVNSTTWVRGSNTQVICTGVCLGIGVSSSCGSGETCWQS